MVDPVIQTRTTLEPGRLLVAALLAVAAFALLITFVSASEWRIDADLKFLAAIAGTMVNIVTGAIIYFAVRFRRTPAPTRSRVFDEDLPRGDIQDGTRAAEDQYDQPQLQ